MSRLVSNNPPAGLLPVYILLLLSTRSYILWIFFLGPAEQKELTENVQWGGMEVLSRISTPVVRFATRQYTWALGLPPPLRASTAAHTHTTLLCNPSDTDVQPDSIYKDMPSLYFIFLFMTSAYVSDTPAPLCFIFVYIKKSRVLQHDFTCTLHKFT